MKGESAAGAFAIDIKCYQRNKRGQRICGDAFLFRRMREENRSLAVLSDGLGSGVKANVLSTLTATMAMRFTAGYRDLRTTAEAIMQTLPVCSVRKISYATFCIVDIDKRGEARIINYDSPPPILISQGVPRQFDSTVIEGRAADRTYSLTFSTVGLSFGDRIILVSDGVSQAGVGAPGSALGWGIDEVAAFAGGTIAGIPEVPARDLARAIVQRAMMLDDNSALDDITCGVVHFRKPRDLLIVSGPPVAPEKDCQLAREVDMFEGRKIVCGGTTAKIVARELGRDLRMSMGDLHPFLPPRSHIDGIDLVTEGIITLHAAAEMLQSDRDIDEIEASPAKSIVEWMLECDIVHFLVGTRINEAWQDPALPAEIGLRRTIISQIIRTLERRHHKETRLRYS